MSHISPRHAKGSLSEILVAAHYIELGCTVCFPYNDHTAYDLIVDTGQSVDRVQVKTIYPKRNEKREVTGVYYGDLFSSSKKQGYDKSDFETMAFVEPLKSYLYLIPFDKIEERKRLSLYPESPEAPTNKCLYEEFRVK